MADAGLSTLISEDTETVDKTALLSTLTKTQAEAVKRRVETYTLRKRNKPPPRDVRDIFSSQVRMLKYWTLDERNCAVMIVLHHRISATN